jgi:osmotically-inducible protein OsmY
MMKQILGAMACALALVGCAEQHQERVDTATEEHVGSSGGGGTDTGSGSSDTIEAQEHSATPLDQDATPDSSAAVTAKPQTLTATDRALMNRVRNNLLGLTDNQGGAISSETLNNLTVEAHRGIVTVRGNVRSDSEKQVITDRLQRMDGVIAVKNELQVAGAQPAAVGAAAGKESGKQKETLPQQRSQN